MAAQDVKDRTRAPEAGAPEMGELLAEAWSSGVLVLPQRDEGSPVRLPGLHKSVLPPSLTGPAEVSLEGMGEHFAAWRVSPHQNAPLIVRIPHVDLAELPWGLEHEIAALFLSPSGVGPEPIAVETGSAGSPIGRPYVVTSCMPGRALPPSAWTEEHLRAHARLLAALHMVPAPGRGPVQMGKRPWRGIPRDAPSLLAEVEEAADTWRTDRRDLLKEHRLKPLLKAAIAQVAAVEPQIRALDGFVLAHGDLCATNILWASGSAPLPSPRYIDFEWAQGDDPARDLAIIGGRAHAGPWYVPMDEVQVDGFVGAYVEERRRLAAERGLPDGVPESASDIGALRDRMRAWTAYERTGMLVHLASRARESALHRDAFGQLRETLAVELGVP